jgi:hypothetical protein
VEVGRIDERGTPVGMIVDLGHVEDAQQRGRDGHDHQQAPARWRGILEEPGEQR